MRDEEEVIALANDNEYGLGGAVWTKNINRALRVARGGRFYTNGAGGATIDAQGLLDRGCKAVFIGEGAGLPVLLGIPRKNLIGACSANEYLIPVNLGRDYAFPAWDTPVYPG